MPEGAEIAVVTGAASGIGKALAQSLKAHGATVVCADLNAEGAQAVATEIGAVARACDVSKESDIAALVDWTEETVGPIDLFCSNAGIIKTDAPQWWATSATNDTWQAMWDIHVMSHVWAARACLPAMIERGDGYFLNTASAAGLLNQIGDAAYSTTKHAAIGFAESLAITHGDDGIKVSCLCPQAVATRMIGVAEDGGTAGVDGVLSPADVADACVRAIAEERFLVLPHEEVQTYRERKTADYDRWLGGMRKLRQRFGNPTL